MFVLLRFLSKAEGGRTRPPRGDYRTVACVIGKHKHGEEGYTLQLWGVPDNLTTEDTILLKADALCPEQFNPGDEFEMYEGAKMVAKGKVVPEP